MKKNLTEMVFILDRSGSMYDLTADTIGGFNSMIEEQKAVKGEAYVTTVLFDDRYIVLHDHVNVQDVKPMTTQEYFARGCTALLDAVGTTINSIGERLANTPEEERPEKVLFVIVTDGYENASTEFKKERIKEMIEHQQNVYSWTFMFLGANMDAIDEAKSYGIGSSYAATYTPSVEGTESVYACSSKAITNLRGIELSACASTDDYITATAYAVTDALINIE